MPITKRTLTTLLAASLIGGALTAAPVSASGALAFTACPNSTAFACATLPVPLARSGALPGAVALSIERKTAGPAPSRDAVVALAGGPGQAALGLGEFAAQALAPALGERDLVVFDQRGTGASDPLACPALESFATGTVAQIAEQCALQLGPARGAFTTAESVEDIEAIRAAAGYDKLVLYGTSYGTKVALEYAARYPQHTEALVLDSVVPADGPEPFSISTFQAIGPALGELCSSGACAGITANPLGDLARLATQLHRRVLSGSVYDGAGRRHPATLSEAGLLGILEAGDLNPALRALLPAAVRSALHNDPDPLLRLNLLAEGLIPNVPHNPPSEGSHEIDEALFLATSCEETPFPWQRASSPATRLAEALASLRTVPSADFYPFDASTALGNGLISACAGWPNAAPAPAPPGALPNVPTLILSGAQDLRTPTANARKVAAQIPDTQLLLVPFTGHSVLGADFSGCAERAVGAFFGGAPVQPCTSSSDLFAPTPVTPTKLAYVRSPPELGGRPGRTLTAALDTILDLNRQVIGATLQADRELPSGSSFGGLHGGSAKLSASVAVLKDLSFIAGVRLSGTIPVKKGVLQTATIHITGTEASPGTVRIGPTSKQVTGALGGRRFDVNLARVKLSRAASSGEWPTHPIAFPLAGLARLR
jgi:pimeloyl-ACP methyl ester carboxylesterase